MDRSYLYPDTNRNQSRVETDHSSVGKSPSTSKQPNANQLDPNRPPKQFSKAQLRDLCSPMFPQQDKPNNIVECMKLKTWNTISPRDQILDPLHHEQIHMRTPFPINDKINRKLALWVGDITNLDCQAIVHTTNENFKEDIPTTRRIYVKAGYEMYDHLRTNITTCRTGDLQVTNGYGLNCRYVFHTVGPKYKEKFHTAAEGALFSCYFKVLNAMREYKVTTLALCPINTVRRAYPVQDAAHIGLRTLRRFLEQHSDEVERIVFVVDDLEIGMYEQILPLYFPRCENEEIYACYKLPNDLGGENGEPLLPERAIRVVDRPTIQPIKYSRHMSEMNYRDYNRKYNANAQTEEEQETNDDFEQSIDLVSGLESSVIVGRTSFAKMKNDVDRKWLTEHGMHANQPIRNSNNRFNRTNSLLQNSAENAYRIELNRKVLYNSLVRQARSTDHSEVMNMKWLYVNGDDRLGRTIIVIIGSHFKSTVSLERALLYFIYQMDRIKDREYTIVYFHSAVNEQNSIPINFLRYVYDTVDQVYIRNLNAIYIVHPSIWFKLTSWWFTTFSAPDLKNKVIHVKSLLDLDTVLELQHLKIPQFILNVDFRINGTRYVAMEANEFFT